MSDSPILTADGQPTCPEWEWLDGAYKVRCGRFLVRGRCGKHWAYRAPEEPKL